MQDSYAAMQIFKRPAMHSADLGSLLAIIVVMELVFILGPALVLFAMPAQWAESVEMGQSPLAIITQLLIFGLYAYALTALVEKQHNRSFWSMVGPLPETLWALKKAGIAVGLLLLIETLLPPTLNIEMASSIRPFIPWLMWIPLTIGALIVQTGTEELYFRGYLQQQLACMSTKRWVWMGLPSLLFGIGHYANGYGPADGVIYAIWATCLGLACADLTARTGNIGAAIGLHLANNLAAYIISGVEDWPSNGLALILFPYEDPAQYDYGLHTLLQPWAVLEVALVITMVLVMWLAARVAIRK